MVVRARARLEQTAITKSVLCGAVLVMAAARARHTVKQKPYAIVVSIVARFSVSSDQCGGSSCGVDLFTNTGPQASGCLRRGFAQPVTSRTRCLLLFQRSTSATRWSTARPRHRSPVRSVTVCPCRRIAAAILDPATCRSLRTSSTAMVSGSRTTTAPAGFGQVDGTGRVIVEGVRPGVRSPCQDGGPVRHASAGKNVTNHATSTGAWAAR
jgi:hypothetical protein